MLFIFSGFLSGSYTGHKGTTMLGNEIDRGQQFAHGGDQGNLARRAAFDKSPIEGLQP
jgi:hypothetical protein